MQNINLLINILILWHLVAFRDFRKKTRLNARGFAQEYLRSCSGYGPSQVTDPKKQQFLVALPTP